MPKKRAEPNDLLPPSKETLILVRKTLKYRNEFDLLLSQPEFRKDIEDIRSKLGIDVDNPKLPYMDNGLFDNLLEGLLKKHGLAKNWARILDVYILTNDFERMFDPQGTRIIFDYNKKKAVIEARVDSTLEEIKDAHKAIVKYLRKGTNSKKVIATQSDRDTFIFDLYQQGKSYKEMKSTLEDNSYGTILEADLSRIVDKMKKRRKKI